MSWCLEIWKAFILVICVYGFIQEALNFAMLCQWIQNVRSPPSIIWFSEFKTDLDTKTTKSRKQTWKPKIRLLRGRVKDSFRRKVGEERLIPADKEFQIRMRGTAVSNLRVDALLRKVYTFHMYRDTSVFSYSLFFEELKMLIGKHQDSNIVSHQNKTYFLGQFHQDVEAHTKTQWMDL